MKKVALIEEPGCL